jgi:lysophospholipase L1-like esterase
MSRTGHRFERYVAIGDSSTEGWDDPDGADGFRGWANRLAERIAAVQGGLLYANLGVRGKRTREILDEQLEPALAMRPDLVTLFSGTNDVIARRFDPPSVAADIERMQRAVRDSGATLLTFTLPDLTPVMPAARYLAPRLAALNESVRRISRSTGTLLVDFAAHPVASDARLWSDDRLHANAAGHARIAAALAHALGLPGTDGGWAEPLPPAPKRGRLGAARDEVAWLRRHLIPWLLRRLRDDRREPVRVAKRPALLPVEAPFGLSAARRTDRSTAVYVDPLLRYASNRRFPWRQSCHLFADSIDELHDFAARLGLQREWFQIGRRGLPHYDLNAERRTLAIELGAVALSRKESVAKWRAMRGRSFDDDPEVLAGPADGIKIGPA